MALSESGRDIEATDPGGALNPGDTALNPTPDGGGGLNGAPATRLPTKFGADRTAPRSALILGLIALSVALAPILAALSAALNPPAPPVCNTYFFLLAME